MEITTTATTTTTTTTGGSSGSGSGERGKHQKWFPLESNPTLMNQYIGTLGWDTSQYHMVDVYSTDDWALEMIPQPVLAVLLLYPLTPIQLQHEQIEREQQQLIIQPYVYDPESVWFMKQRIGNACGTIGLLHAMMNAYHTANHPKTISQPPPPPLIQPDSWLDTFMTKSAMNDTNNNNNNNINNNTNELPIQRAELLENDTSIASLHDAATSSTENSTERGTMEDDIITHFIAFVIGSSNDDDPTTTTNTNSTTTATTALYELDGRKSQPIRHTTTSSSATLLRDSCTIIREQFMARDPMELRFTMVALVPNHPSDDE